MLEDKLSAEQRIRLEGFAQACNAAQFKGQPSTLEHLLEEAADIATFVAGAPDTLESITVYPACEHRPDTGKTPTTPCVLCQAMHGDYLVAIPKALLRKKIYVSDDGSINCNETEHKCDGGFSWSGRRMDIDELISTLIEHFE